MASAAGIGRNVRVEKQSREETSTHWEARYRGLCKTTQYYVAVPVKHTVEYDHEIVTFQPNKEAIEVCQDKPCDCDPGFRVWSCSGQLPSLAQSSTEHL